MRLNSCWGSIRKPSTPTRHPGAVDGDDVETVRPGGPVARHGAERSDAVRREEGSRPVEIHPAGRRVGEAAVDDDVDRNRIAQGQNRAVHGSGDGETADAHDVKHDAAGGDGAETATRPQAIHLDSIQRARHRVELHPAPGVSVVVVVVGNQGQRVAGIAGVNPQQADKQQDKYIGIGSLKLEQHPLEIWFEELEFPLLLLKQVFKNEDDTVGALYLACSDLNLSYGQITAIYKKRWSVERYHKSVKSNASFAKSPTKTITTQLNHFMLSILAYVKLEWLQIRNNLNHFAMKAKIYMAALKAAKNELLSLSTPRT